jgi:Tol biopolymer transport system component
MKRAKSMFVALALLISIACSSTENQPSPATSSGEGSSHETSAGQLEPSGFILFGRVTGRGHVGVNLTANADGSDERQLTEPGEYCCLLRISPDHSSILVMPGEDPPPGTPVTGGMLSLDGSDFELLTLTDPTLNLVPQAWSPDGRRIAFEGWDDSDPSRTGIYTARASDGGDLVRVTDTGGRPHDMPLDYSPDGTQLVFYREIRTESQGDTDIGGSLWVVNIDGSDAHELDTGAVRPWWHARWSPDGSKILFGVERLQLTGGLWTIKPDGSGLTKVFEDPAGGFAEQPTWSPDGRQIMFALNPTNDAFTHPENGLYVIRADGTGLTLVIGTPDFKSQPEWWG